MTFTIENKLFGTDLTISFFNVGEWFQSFWVCLLKKRMVFDRLIGLEVESWRGTRNGTPIIFIRVRGYNQLITTGSSFWQTYCKK
jgi:hypothetical protein